MIDFLIRLITPMEGVDYAIAPIVLAGLAQLPGMVQGISASNAAKRQAEKDERRARADKSQAQRALSNLRAGKLEFEPVKDKLSERYTDAYEMSMSRAPEQAAREAREQALASALATGGDPRAMGASMQAAAQFSQAGRSDALAGLSNRQSATSTLAGLEQGVQDANLDRYRSQFDKELLGAQQLFTSSRAQERQARDAQAEAKRSRNQAILGAAVGTAGGALQMQGIDKFGDIFKSSGALKTVGNNVMVGSDMVDKSKGVQGLLGALSKGANLTGAPSLDTSTAMPVLQGDPAAPDMNPNATFYPDSGDGSMNLINPETGVSFTPEEFQQIQALRNISPGHHKSGGKIGKTGGEFNHDTNKKALIDEESGEKEAELTGDETMFVFNPKQSSAFEKMVKGNDAVGLMKFMKKLLKKPQFNK